MNWLQRIRDFLGIFWVRIFGDQDFILGIENILAWLFGLRTVWLTNMLSSMVQQSAYSGQDRMPFVIDVDVSSISKAGVDFSEITSGTKALGDLTTADLWVCKVRETVSAPLYVQNHVTQATSVLLGGVDYVYSDDRFYFRIDPETLQFDTVKLTVDGNLKLYYRFYGFPAISAMANEAAAGLLSPDLASHAAAAWDIHVNGATDYNVKQLLGEVTASVICKEAGAVTDIWTEQNYRCLQVGPHVYMAPTSVSCNVSVGDSVAKGCVLFGDLRVYRSTDTPTSSEVPGIRVNTDVGELTAPNQTLASYVQSGYNILPLTGDSATVAAYKNRCAELSADPHALYTDVPSTVNPMEFVTKKLRKRRGRFITLSADRLSDVDPALDCIRKSTDASAVVTVFIRATGEAITANVKGFVSSACMAAVSEYQTIKLADAGSEASILL